MKFVIANIELFERMGYNTKYWRKSIDGNKTICHLEYAEILDNGIQEEPDTLVVDAAEAQDIMNSEEWTSKEEE
ncbi:hypothetical protein [Staphylococcus phage LY01]|nr:hypothetical protein [Staphylococcus phage LY01]